MKKLHIVLLTLVIFLGLILRTVNLSHNPPGFFADEAVIGLDAYSLLYHGTDHGGKPPGFFFRGLGFPLGFVPIISTIPFVGFLGLSEQAVRFPSALYGTLSLLLVYAIAKSLWKHEGVALVASALLSISPWHIHISRLGLEVSGYLFWLLLSLWLFLRGTKQPIYLFLSAISFGLTLYTYSPARFTVPAFLSLLTLMYVKALRKSMRYVISAFSLFLFLAFPTVRALTTGEALVRFSSVSEFSKTSLFEAIPHVARAYVNYFSPVFLFTKGDIDFPGQFITRHSIRGIGLLYMLQLPFVVAGLLVLLRRYRHREAQLLMGSLLLYPLPAALAKELNPYATRGILAAPLFALLTGVGFYAVYRWFNWCSKNLRTLFVISVALVSVTSFMSFLHAWRVYPTYTADFWGWQFGPRDVMQYFLEHKHEYDELLLVGNFNSPEIFLQFYDPENSCVDRCKIGDASKLNSQEKQLFAIGADRMSEFPMEKFKSDRTIYYPNGSPAFFLGTFSSPAI